MYKAFFKILQYTKHLKLNKVVFSYILNLKLGKKSTIKIKFFIKLLLNQQIFGIQSKNWPNIF